MATRQLLAALSGDFSKACGLEVDLHSMAGVDAARKVREGELFDVILLAADAIQALATSGHVLADSLTPFVDSPTAIAVRTDAPVPDIGSPEALRQALEQARSIGYSTGPSGTALLQRLEHWGLAESLAARLVQARPGVPVGQLIASGEVDLGFQQLSELMNIPGITVLGEMPPGLAIMSRFTAGIGATSPRGDDARALIRFLAAPPADAFKTRFGMRPPA